MVTGRNGAAIRLGELKIGSLTLPGNVLLAPMAGVSDLPFRLICRELGASMAVTEMVSAKAVLYGNRNTKKLMEIAEEERPAAIQLFGSDPEIMGEIAARLNEAPCDAIDVNMGCPVPKIVKNNEGSALMRDPALAGEILESMVRRSKKPVTVKIRKGFNEENVNAPEFAKMAEAAGVSAITVHGRTREQYYAGKADLEIIRKVKEAVRIPVIGNGDIFTAQDAARMLKETGCDGVMVARGAKGNPWIFREIKALLEKGITLPPPSLEEKREMIRRHARMLISYKGERTAIRELRGVVAWYTKGLPNSARFRDAIGRMEYFEDLETLLKLYLGGEGR